jgi:hypothetical protein
MAAYCRTKLQLLLLAGECCLHLTTELLQLGSYRLLRD